MLSRIDPKIDFAFKWLFGQERNIPLLVHLLNAVLKPPAGSEIISLELLNPYNMKDAIDDKLSIVDVKARDLTGRQFGVEMQLLTEHSFLNRILYYWASLHAQQLKQGDIYQKLRPTISVCITDFSLFPQSEEYCLVFELCNRQHNIVFSSDIMVITLELTKFKKKPEQITNPLEQWLYFMRHGQELNNEDLPKALNIPEIHMALEVLNMLSQDDLERERYLARMRVLTDEQSRLYSAREEGLEKGREEGLEKGREDGLRQILRVQLEKRFGMLSEKTQERLNAMSWEELMKLGSAIFDAQSLQALGLDKK